MSGERAFESTVARDVLSVMSTCGMYDYAGNWQFTVGLPAKSGVGGGLLAVAPGKGAIAVFSPPLDEAGNSVRGQETIQYVANKLDLNIYTPASVGVK